MDENSNIISKKYSDFYKISQNEQTYDLCLDAVKEDGWNIKYIKKEFQTNELCMAAINQTWLAFDLCPPHIRTKSLMVELLRKRYVEERIISIMCESCNEDLSIKKEWYNKQTWYSSLDRLVV